MFAVPGSPLDPRCRGCNDLLRNGATLTENAADVGSGRCCAAPLLLPGRLRPDPELPLASIAPAPPPDRTDDFSLDPILEKLSPTPVAVDELVRQCQLSAATVATLLLELELAGRVERLPATLCRAVK